jgi:hypothetical protein
MRLMLFGAFMLLPAMVWSAGIEGRVVQGDEPLAGVVVSAYATLDFTSDPVAVSEQTGPDGLYRLDVDPGSYALFGWTPDRSVFAFCGRNPVNIEGENVWAGLQTVPVDKPLTDVYDDDYTAAIEGHVLHQGQPLAKAYVYLYLDVRDDLKGQGYQMSIPTSADGFFRFDGLPESNYFLVARHRQDGQRVGPVQEGDLVGVYPGNPLTALAGHTLSVRLHTVEKIKDMSATETFGRATGPVVRGRILDSMGQGVAGVHVFAYLDRVIGHQRPAAISPPTSNDGLFQVHLPAPGIYYIGAREGYGDSPAPGELFGMYDETADHGLELEEGEVVEDLHIVVEPIQIF